MCPRGRPPGQGRPRRLHLCFTSNFPNHICLLGEATILFAVNEHFFQNFAKKVEAIEEDFSLLQVSAICFKNVLVLRMGRGETIQNFARTGSVTGPLNLAIGSFELQVLDIYANKF